MENSHRIKIKIGNAEFDAEGSADLVNAQYEAFIGAVAALPVAGTAASRDPDPGPLKPPAGELDASILNRVFRSNDGVVSLLGLPRTDQPKADGLIALLYGFDELLGQKTVTGVTLNKAARISGINLDRIDREIVQKEELYMKAGQRRGTTYSLNNRGREYAKGVIVGIIE